LETPFSPPFGPHMGIRSGHHPKSKFSYLFPAPRHHSLI
jgi:hypothetical protein